MENMPGGWLLMCIIARADHSQRICLSLVLLLVRTKMIPGVLRPRVQRLVFLSPASFERLFSAPKGPALTPGYAAHPAFW